MAIYTSNYARKGSDPNAVSISRKAPDWFTGLHLPHLAPTWDMIMGVKEGRITRAQYTEQYIAILDAIKMDDWGAWLQQTPDPTYFLCYETPTDFCHRHLFSAWIEDKCGWVIPEWLNEKEVEEQRQQDTVDELLGF